MGFLLVFFFITVASTEQWNHKELDTKGIYHLYWKIKGNIIMFQVEVATRGWVGFGISPNGGMAGSDVIVAWVSNGRTTFHDRYAEGKYMPIIDSQQDWELLWAGENATHTVIQFQREIDTCDKEQDLEIMRTTTRVIYSYQEEDPPSPNAVMYHGPANRGTKSINFFGEGNDDRYLGDPQDLSTWEIRSANVTIPHDIDTAYFCTFMKRPRLNGLHHVVKTEPVVQPGNERFVHHMILYECTNAEESLMEPLLRGFHECYTEDQVPKFTFCYNAITGWAVGGEATYSPEHAGVPFGRSNAVYYLLEVHYDNPGYVQGITDNSGLRVTYTSKLRMYHSGILTTGNPWYACMFIPPRQRSFVVSGHAHPACLRQSIPKSGIKVFGVLLHTHLAGKTVRVRHFRNRVELPPIIKDDNYDFNYQNYVSLPNEVVILPNDHLIVECTYDTSGRDETTFGGLSTQQEMCLALFSYYPEVELALSISCPSPMNVVKRLGVTKMSDDDRFVISPITGRNESYIDFLNSYPWDSSSESAVQKAMMYSPHINICGGRGGKFKPVFSLSRYPDRAKIYEEPDKCSGRGKQKHQFYHSDKEVSLPQILPSYVLEKI